MPAFISCQFAYIWLIQVFNLCLNWASTELDSFLDLNSPRSVTLWIHLVSRTVFSMGLPVLLILLSFMTVISVLYYFEGSLGSRDVSSQPGEGSSSSSFAAISVLVFFSV